MKVKEFIVGTLSVILVCGILIATPFAIGKISNIFEKTIGTEYKNIKREQFENSDSYVHGMIDDLAKYKREYDRAETVEEKQAIITTIDDMYAEFDETKIDNSTLRDFLENVRSGNLLGGMDNE